MNKSRSKWWMLPLMILVICSLTASGIIITAKRNQQSASATNCTGALATNFGCYKRQLSELVSNQNPKAAFAVLKANYKTSDYVQSQCHQLTHVIGQTATKKYADITTAYQHGDSFCWSGYYHGVMQGIAAKIGYQNLESQTNTICDGVSKDKKRYGFDHFNCVHGLGHGFMGIQSNELFTSLKTCDALIDNWERESCYGGVFMENVMAFQSEDTKTDYLKADDPLYPCTAVTANYKTQCYLMQTSHALVVKANDFAKVFEVCAQVPEVTYQNTCYQSLGRDASGQSTSNVAATKAKCLLGQSEVAKTNCIIGAVKDFISYFHGQKESQALCASLSDYPAIRTTCQAEAKAYYQLL